MKINLNKLIDDNPEFNINFYDIKDCQNFINKYFGDKVLETYNSLIPYAYKSDLARLCILYIQGGIYLDIKYTCVNNFKFIYLTDKEYFVLSRIYKTNNIEKLFKNNDYGIYNGLIIVKPYNKFIIKCIKKIISNVKNKYYGYKELYPTGPGLLGNIYFKYFKILKLLKIKLFHIYDYNEKKFFITYKKLPILKYYSNYYDEQLLSSDIPNYDLLFKMKNIYNK